MRKFKMDVSIVFTKVYTPSVKYRALPFCVESFSHFKAGPGYSAERAELACYILLYTIEGAGILEIKGKSYRVSKNQVVFIDCQEHHIYRSANGKPWEFYFMLIMGDGVKAYYDVLFAERYYVLEYFDHNIIQKFMETMLYLDGKRSQQFELLACHQVNDLLIQLLMLNTDTANFAFIQTLEYIEENYERKITVDELAGIAKMSKYHFTRKFKRIYDENPYEYVTRYRVNKGKALLSVSEFTVDEIAQKIGFNDTSTFIRAFKNLVGITPNKYRSSTEYIHNIPE